MVLNDYIAGYLGAAGILAALRRRAEEGGSYHVRVILTRAAMWYQNIGMVDRDGFDPNEPDHRMIEQRTISGDTPYGRLNLLAPQNVRIESAKRRSEVPHKASTSRGGQSLPESPKGERVAVEALQRLNDRFLCSVVQKRSVSPTPRRSE